MLREKLFFLKYISGTPAAENVFIFSRFFYSVLFKKTVKKPTSQEKQRNHVIVHEHFLFNEIFLPPQLPEKNFF